MADHSEVVLGAFERLNAQDLGGFVAACTDDVVSISPLGTVHGRSEFQSYLDTGFAGMSHHWRRVERLIVSGDDVATLLRFGGTIESTGKSFEVEVITVFGIRDGHIASIDEYADYEPAFAAFVPD